MKIQLKRSSVLDAGSAKTPTAAQLEYGELAINYNTSDPAIFLKDSNNNIIRISGVGNIADDGQVELPASTTPPSSPEAGNLWYNSDQGRLYIYYNDGNTSQWVDASPDSWDPSTYPDTTNSSAQSGTIDDRYVMANGDDMTGNLTLGTNKVVLNATSGAATFGQASNSTNNNGILLGADVGQLNLYTTRYNTDCFQVVNTSGSGTNVAVRFDGDGSATFAGGSFAIDADGEITTNVKSQGHIELDSTGAFTSPKIKLFANTGEGTYAGPVYTGGYTNGSKTEALAAQISTSHTVGLLIGSTSSSLNANTAIQVKNSGGSEVAGIKADGTATFTGRVDAGSSTLDNAAIVAAANHATKGAIQAYHYNSGSVWVAGGADGVTTSEIKADGSATFSGTFKYDFNTNYQKGIRMLDNAGHSMMDISGTGANATAFAVYDGATNTYNVKIKHDGTATFAGDVAVDTGMIVGANAQPRVLINKAYGIVVKPISLAGGGSATDLLWTGYSNDGSTVTSKIAANGSANFATQLITGSANSITSTSSHGSYIGEGIVVNAIQPNATLAAQERVWLGKLANVTKSEIFKDGSATFVGNVTTKGKFILQESSTDAFSVNCTGANGAFNIKDEYNGSDRLTISNQGRVGVGTTSPVATFDVRGTVYAGGKVGIDNTATSSYASDGSDLVIGSGSGSRGLTIASAGNGAGTIYFADGTSGASLYTGTITYNHASNYMAFWANESERLRIDSSGRLLLGTTSAGWSGADEFTLAGSGSVGMTIRAGDTSSVSAMYFADGTSGSENYQGIIQYKHSTDDLQFYTNYSGNSSARMTLDSDGRLLINHTGASGAISAAAPLQVTASTSGAWAAQFRCRSNNDYAFLDFTNVSGAEDLAQIGAHRVTASTGRLSFWTNNGGNGSTERMRISEAGELFVNSTSKIGSGLVSISFSTSHNAISIKPTSSTLNQNYLFFLNSSGSVAGYIRQTGTTTTFFGTSSDHRLKENVVDISDGITRVKQLQPRRFNFISDADTTVDGFLAHEAQTVVPEAVSGTHNEVEVWQETDELPEGVSVGDNKLDDEGNTVPVMQGIDQAKLVPLLTAALQEAIAKIEILEAKVAALEAG